MVFGTAVGLELVLLLLCCTEGLRCDLWCFLLQAGLEPVPPEYQPFDRVMSSSIRVRVFICGPFRNMSGGVSVLIFIIFVVLSS